MAGVVGSLRVDVARTFKEKLLQPFSIDDIKFRVGATFKSGNDVKGMPLVYADSRAYEVILDGLLGMAWSSNVEVQEKSVTVIVSMHQSPVYGSPVYGSSRSATADIEGGENAVMTAEARAFKRACSSFGLGRYLYGLKMPYVTYPLNNKNKPKIDNALEAQLKAKVKESGMLVSYLDVSEFEKLAIPLGLTPQNVSEVTRQALGWSTYDLSILTRLEGSKLLEYIKVNTNAIQGISPDAN